MKKYAYGWITLAFFTVSIALHWDSAGSPM